MSSSEVVPHHDSRLKRIERLGYLLDNSIRIPILGYRVGWDAVIGLVPGVGDVAGFLLSAYLVLEAARFRLPIATVGRMVVNIGIEALVGAVPVLGDVFDATWKANARNVGLLEQHLGERPAQQRTADRRFMLGVVGALVALLVLSVALVAAVGWALTELLGSG